MSSRKRFRVTQEQIAVRANVDQTAVSKILNNYPNHGIPEVTVNKVVAAAKELGYDLAQRFKNNDRRWDKRKPVNLKAYIKIILESGKIYDEGFGIIQDLSKTGAMITNLRLHKQSLPLQAFHFLIELNDKFSLTGELQRFLIKPDVQLGIIFNRLGEDEKKHLNQILD